MVAGTSRGTHVTDPTLIDTAHPHAGPNAPPLSAECAVAGAGGRPLPRDTLSG